MFGVATLAVRGWCILMPMMDAPTDKQVWQLAIMLVEKHGTEAIRVVEERVEQAQGDGDTIGFGAWSMIAEAVKELLRGPHGGGEMN
jgi:hypothetical protein